MLREGNTEPDAVSSEVFFQDSELDKVLCSVILVDELVTLRDLEHEVDFKDVNLVYVTKEKDLVAT